MSTPSPAPARPSAAARYLFVLALGLLLGLVATVIVGRALQARQDPFPHSLMHVMDRQLELLRTARQQNRCSLADSLPRLQTLRLLSNDLDLAFPALKDSAGFQQHASQYRAGLNAALATPPSDCTAMGAVLDQVGEGCQACHQDFR